MILSDLKLSKGLLKIFIFIIFKLFGSLEKIVSWDKSEKWKKIQN